jgi:hypothetical protein
MRLPERTFNTGAISSAAEALERWESLEDIASGAEEVSHGALFCIGMPLSAR